MKKETELKDETANIGKVVLAAGLPKEKVQKIANKLDKIGMLINSIECDLHGTDLKEQLLVPNEAYDTLWCQIYLLEQAFKACS